MPHLSRLFLAIGSCCLTSHAVASDFGLPFVNSAGLGVAYADWATAANDASTSYTNPAGLINIHNKQIVGNALGIFGGAQFKGTSQTPPYPFPFPVSQSGTATTPIGAFSPSFYYAAPITDRATFGFGVTAPFGLGTNYKRTSIVRYAATNSQVVGLDAGPSIGFKLFDFLSLGAGFDILRLSLKLNNMYGPPLSFPIDTALQNKMSGWGYGWHGGALINILPKTRIGLSYNSNIHVSPDGKSTVASPVGSLFGTYHQKTRATLPDRAQLSLQHDLTNRWTGMFTVFYTGWSVFKQVTLQNTETPFDLTVPATIPFNYRNCFDYAVGTAFKANDKWLLRGGIQFMSTPSNNIDRNVADPIGSATILTVGAHFQQSKALGYDLGIGHSFFKQMPIHFANQLTSLNGHTNAQTTVVGGQITWNIG